MKPSKKDSNISSNRFLNFIRKFITNKHHQKNEQNSYQRTFDRFPIEFEVVVSLIDSKGEIFRDKAGLHDVSGSGAMFITRNPEKYHLQQQLDLKIYLAGTDDVRACIKAESTVVRMQKFADPEQDNDPSLTGIAVKFHKTFEFERVDQRIFGEFK